MPARAMIRVGRTRTSSSPGTPLRDVFRGSIDAHGASADPFRPAAKLVEIVRQGRDPFDLDEGERGRLVVDAESDAAVEPEVDPDVRT
jgi:hypothetical protein